MDTWSGSTTQKGKYFLKNNNAESEVERLVLDLFLFFKKALYVVKASGQQFSFNTFR